MANIVQTAISAGKFKSLVKAIEKAGLVDILSGVGPFTVFAPNDEAFSKVPKNTLDGFLANKDQLIHLLKYHVTAGAVHTKDINKAIECKTLEGETIRVRPEMGVMVNGAHVIQADIKCDNGIIHVIDTILVPKSIQRKQAA